MKRARLLAAALVFALLLCGSASTTSQGSVPARSVSHADAPRTVPIPSWLTRPLRNLGRRVLNKEFAKRMGKKAAKNAAEEAFDLWLDSGATDCPQFLPEKYFCNETPARWGVGQALSWRGRSPGTWSSPVSPRRYLGSLPVGGFFWLTCFWYGDLVTDGGIRTSLWYRLSNNYWVNDGWVDTGTNSVIKGVRRC
jgi:hypothetical protein